MLTMEGLPSQPPFCWGLSSDGLNLFKDERCLIIFSSDIREYFLWMLTLNNVEEVFVLFVSDFHFMFPVIINIPLSSSWQRHEECWMKATAPLWLLLESELCQGVPKLPLKQVFPASLPSAPPASLAPQCYQKTSFLIKLFFNSVAYVRRQPSLT